MLFDMVEGDNKKETFRFAFETLRFEICEHFVLRIINWQGPKP